MAVPASVGKVEGTATQLGRSSTITRNTIGSSDEGNVVVFGGEGPAFGADGAGSITAGSRRISSSATNKKRPL